MRGLELLTLFCVFTQLVHGNTAFPFRKYEYDPMPEAVLVLGTLNPGNEAIIDLLSSDNYLLTSWTLKEELDDGKFLHPIVTKNANGKVFVNCLFFTPNTSNYISDYYLEVMLRSVEKGKIILLTPIESFQEENDGFFNLLDWFAGVFANPGKFQGSTILLVTGEATNATKPEIIMEQLSKYHQNLDKIQINTSLLLPKMDQMKATITGFQSPTKVGFSWELPNAIHLINEIPFYPILPTDMTLISAQEAAATGYAAVSSITEEMIAVFNNALANVEAKIGSINEESFSARLRTLEKIKVVVEETRKEMNGSKDYNGAAQTMTTNFGVIGLNLDPSFREKISVGQELLHHIQTATGSEEENFKTLLARIDFVGLINTTTHKINRYANFSGILDALDGPNVHGPGRHNVKYLFGNLSEKNMTIASAIANQARNVPSEGDKKSPILPQDPIGAGLMTNTVYNIHPEDDDDCFLVAINEKVEYPCTTDPNITKELSKEVYIPYMSCSPSDKNEFYDKPEASWFLSFDYPYHYLRTLKKGDRGFPWFYNCKCTVTGRPAVNYQWMANQVHKDGGRVAVGTTEKQNIAILSHIKVLQYNGKSRAPLKWIDYSSEFDFSRLRFTPAFKLEAKLSAFEFEEPDPFESSKKDFADSFAIANNGPTEVKRTIELSETITDTFSFGFSQDLSICAKVGIKAEANFGFGKAEASAEVSTELKVGSHQDWTKTTEKTIKMSYEVTIPPSTTSKISAWYQKVSDVKMAFTTKIQMSGNVSRITKYNDVIEGEAASGGDIYEYLVLKGWKAPNVNFIKINDFSVEYEMEGEMTASVGLKGQIGVTSSPLNQ